MRTTMLFSSWMLLGCAMASAQVDGKDDLRKVLKPVIGAASYTFTAEETPSPGGKGGVTVRYQKGQPLAASADKIDFFKDGDKVVYREKDEWLRSKTGTVSDPLRVLGSVAKVRTLRLPHEELAGLADVDKASSSLEVHPGNATDRYVMKLKLDVAQRLAPTQYKDVVKSGEVELFVFMGQLTRYKISLRLQGKLGNAEIDGNHVRTMAISDVGATKVEVPEAARQALK